MTASRSSNREPSEHERALDAIAASKHGAPEAMLTARGIRRDVLNDLVAAGEVVRASTRPRVAVTYFFLRRSRR
jgi:hypothetical protein